MQAEIEAAAAPPLWEFVPLDAYTPPSGPVSETVRKGLLGLWDRLRRKSPASNLVEPEGLSEVEGGLLDAVVPEPDWADPAAALDDALAGWPAADASLPALRVVVDAPYSGTLEVLRRWADGQGWRLLDAPSPEQILDGGAAWTARLAEAPEAPFVLPSLAHCYLRHHHGLGLVRRLLDLLWERRFRCLIGCSSWAWAYLGQAIQFDALVPPPLVLQAFDAGRLERWFQDLATRDGAQAVVFRQSNNGAFVLPPVDAAHTESEASGEVAAFLKHLAGYSGGLPGLAWTLWRQSLRETPQKPDPAPQEQPPPATAGPGRTVWVKPWADLNLPAIPETGRRSLLLMLHTLLLHDGLPEPLLTALLPDPPGAVMRTLHQLQAARLLDETAGRWQVTPSGYPVARRFIQSEGYLAPAF